MLRYIGKRIILMIPVLIGVLLIVFTMNYITPGDPARMILGEQATQEAVDQLREEMGLNDPYWVRFGNYVKELVVNGSLGNSYKTKLPVAQEVLNRLPTTITLTFTSLFVAVIIGIPIGIISAVKQNSMVDNVGMVVALIGVSMPAFWLALMLIIVFALNLGWLPGSGWGAFKYMILPSITIGAGSAGGVARMTRSSMLEVIRQDYMRTARAKGQSEGVVITRHAFKNALIPVITQLGIQVGYSIGGAVLTETIFSIPGVGTYMVNAIKARDYMAVQGGVLILALVFCCLNLAVDCFYAFADPRIKAMYSGGSKKKAKAAKQPKGAEA
ncbi:MAG: ABC transporter permease [Clostridia bacterium]|nr:ABC transporter permease [Clostridia bacterium]